ncbi:MAG: sulfur carrier protein ThiS [Syntrophorhabdaceae bacterium]
MKVNINGTSEEVSEDLTIEGLLAYKNVEQPLMVTVELNGDILKRDLFSKTKIRENDSIEFLYFMGGGSGNE